ncbi:MAG: lysophospholipase [Eubacterium sp.]|nr:lysophospholipase [Eubacterium sp.]
MRPSIVTFPPEGVQPIGIIEFVHGMCEHKGRYLETMKEFNRRGYICAIADLRGHGDNALSDEDLGYFGREGYRALIDDVYDYTLFLKREYPNLPLILFGHSMGSLIVRTFVKRHSDDVDALIVCGSPSKVAVTGLAKLLIRITALFRGWRHRSPLLTNMVFSSYERPFRNEGILNSWLCTDRNVVDAYNKDPKCGFMFTLNGYKALMNLLKQTYSRKGYRMLNRLLPVMFISGEDDPCKRSNNAFKKSVTHMKRCGFKNVYYKLYPGLRHEIMNEPDNKEVYDDIMKFLEVKAGLINSQS